MSEENTQKPDISGLLVKINGHLNKVTGLRINIDDDDKKWIQLGTKDEDTNFHQCIEVEISGLIKVWDYFTGVPGQLTSVIEGVSDVGKEILGRFERAIEAFNSKE